MMNQNEDFIKLVVENNLINTLFQPVVDLSDGNIIGYEAFSRGPENSNMYSPLSMIYEAKNRKMIGELDTLFRKDALENAAKQGMKRLLFLNVDPDVIYQGELLTDSGEEELDIPNSSIVIEITERSNLCNFNTFSQSIKRYKEAGFKIALDDIGSGFSELDCVSKIGPDFVKIDNILINGMDQDAKKQDTVQSIIKLSEITGSKIIAEGVESEKELLELLKLGVYAAQGKYFGTPETDIKGVNPDAVNCINQYYKEKYDQELKNLIDETASE